MKIPIKQLFVVTIAGIGASLFVPQPSLAQPTNGINQQNYESPNRIDPFAQGVEPNNFNPFQLLHNANLFNQGNNSMSNEELNSAISDYQRKLQERFSNQQPTTPNSQRITPGVITPQSGK
ncbi:hypothetical protein [Iningainema tapete]|uniref:Uncharacterized protein n=1 Tax=Iningainema tapete BLCC-T55 TaxID=2748662 RepID=A0A8J6XZ62_9CYAN|nr:hypothetical protein [Iningainema tapete]MBD2775858.1 hypothetical protein [Iningainema tapete BLCC-T55]